MSGGMPTGTEAARVPIYESYGLDKLPAAYQPLLDPAQALPAEVAFFPTQANPLIFIATLVGVVLLVLCGILAFVGNIGYNRGLAVPDNWLIGVAVFCFIAALAAALAARAQFRRLRVQWRGGQARFGLFLAPDALLLRENISYYWLPREAIIGCALAEGRVRVRYREPAGDEKVVDLPQDLGKLTAPQLFPIVMGWYGTGMAAPDAPGPTA